MMELTVERGLKRRASVRTSVLEYHPGQVVDDVFGSWGVGLLAGIVGHELVHDIFESWWGRKSRVSGR